LRIQRKGGDVKVEKEEKDLEKRLSMMVDLEKDLNDKIVKIKEELENKLSEILDKNIKLSVKEY